MSLASVELRIIAIWIHQKNGFYELWAAFKSNPGAWWMPLMEKAYAKIHVNYENLIAGSPLEAMRILTGMPTFTTWHANI